MPKFENLKEVFWHIRKKPLEFLPEKSLLLFNAFWIGYEWRYAIEFNDAARFDLEDGFNEFMCRKFKVPSNLNSLNIAEFYTQNQAEAFDLWFSCLEEFIQQKNPELETKVSTKAETDFLNQALLEKQDYDLFCLLKNIIFKRLAMYVGSHSFTLAVSIISGWMRCIEDFGLVNSEQEQTFKDFQKYIEERPFWLRPTDTASLPPIPSWNKIIWFRAAHKLKEEKALEIFAEYFDEFAFQNKKCVEYIEFHWKVQNEETEFTNRML